MTDPNPISFQLPLEEPFCGVRNRGVKTAIISLTALKTSDWILRHHCIQMTHCRLFLGLEAKIIGKLIVPSFWDEAIYTTMLKCKSALCYFQAVNFTLHKLWIVCGRLIRMRKASFCSAYGYISHIFILRRMMKHRCSHWISTIALSFFISDSNSLNGSMSWACILRKSVPEKFNTLKVFLQKYISVRTRNQLSPLFKVNSRTREGFPISPFFFIFTMTFWNHL